ncbi:MAG: hypothetical protein JW741_09095 [Sedimentisphaerales bacterium]|nr:hypothetical protein [Sedimentisphaerales bacterium]
MDLLSLIPDNITEILTKVIRFSALRSVVLHQNIKEADTPGYVPADLPVREFAEILEEAVVEHLRSHRLLFRDTANITFCENGRMNVRPVTDEIARTLRQANPDEYVALQRGKLRENSLNRQVTLQLLKRSCSKTTSLHEPGWEAASAANRPTELSSRPNMTD